MQGCPGKNSEEIKTFGVLVEDAEAWCANLRISLENLTSNDRVCSHHFEEKWLGKKRLMFGARPIINLGTN